MKSSALQLAKQIVYDNKNYIDGNIAEYMILEVESSASNMFQYLTDEEIEDIQDTNDMFEASKLQKKLTQDVKDMFLTNFNFDISEFEY